MRLIFNLLVVFGYNFVDRVNVPYIAQTCGTNQFLRLEFRNKMVKNLSRSHEQRPKYQPVSNRVHNFRQFYTSPIIAAYKPLLKCTRICRRRKHAYNVMQLALLGVPRPTSFLVSQFMVVGSRHVCGYIQLFFDVAGPTVRKFTDGLHVFCPFVIF